MSACAQTLSALSRFAEVLRRVGHQPEQSFKLETARYFEELYTRLEKANRQEQFAVLDEIARTGKITELGLSAEELDLYMKLYNAAESDLKGLKREH